MRTQTASKMMIAVMVMVMLFMNVTMVSTAMENSVGSALGVFVAISSYCGGDRFEDEFFL